MTDNKMNPEEKKKVRNASHRYGRKVWKNGSRDFGTMLDYVKADFTAGAEYGYDLAMEGLKDVWDQACREQREECAMSVAGESDHTGMRFVAETDDDLRLHIINALSAPAPEFKITEKE